MNIKNKIFMRLVAGGLFLIMSACANDGNNSLTDDPVAGVDNPPNDELATTASLGELTFGLMASIDAFPIVIADYNGYFADEGLSVNLEPFSSAADRDAALLAGLLDGATIDLVAVGLSRAADVMPLKATGSTSGRFTLVANEGFNSIAELAGESVVISYNTAIHFVLDQMVELAGFHHDHITREVIPSIPARLESLRAGQVAAALLPEPWATIAMADGLYGITNTIEIDFIPFVIAFTDEIIDTMPEEIRAFYRAYNRAIDFLNATPLADYFQLMVDVIGFPADVANHLVLPEFTHNQMPDEYVRQAAIDWLVNRELIPSEITADDLVSTIAAP